MNAARASAIMACASALPAEAAMIRISGSGYAAWAEQLGIGLGAPWQVCHDELGGIPIRHCFAPGPRSATGEDLWELVVPGSQVVVNAVLAALRAVGFQDAEPGDFTRRALAHGRVSIDQAESLLALVHAMDAPAAERALQGLRGGLAQDLGPARQELLRLRAVVEAGLDFIDEPDVQAYDPAQLAARCAELAAVCARWLRGGAAIHGMPVVCLVGPANAGKSALFNALSGGSALVSPVAGTTRDWLEGEWPLAERTVRLIDTAGWLDAVTGNSIDDEAIARGRQLLASADLVLAMSAPDAPLPAQLALPEPHIIIASKADLADSADPRHHCRLSVVDGSGVDELAVVVDEALAASPGLLLRQCRLLQQALDVLKRLSGGIPEDTLLAEDLRRAADYLSDLIGVTTTDDILGEIFSSFCIGK